jgi:hypothetical protein
MYIAEVSEIHPDDLEKLFYNGFDNPDSVELCTEQDLEQLGVSDPSLTLQRLKLTTQAYREQGPLPEQEDAKE